MNKKLLLAFSGIGFAMMVLFTGCKQDAIIGERVPENGKVFFRLLTVPEPGGSMG
ncbi:hypothetical protein [Niabella hibiscisoli]|uniref:hypothetical protein n=1 Tax=Niabella hibiscisoli TaxID=1825928 RepID=UPI001F0FA995|nr:hypothetical protein [Niabella hibiscisoli]MCH5719659.1 hypothetical protein [Niabella hibiscisoli]